MPEDDPPTPEYLAELKARIDRLAAESQRIAARNAEIKREAEAILRRAIEVQKKRRKGRGSSAD